MRASLNTAGDQEMSGGKGLGKEDVAIRQKGAELPLEF